MSRRSRERAKRYAAVGKSRRASASPVSSDEEVVVGWFAKDDRSVLCDGHACVIAGSQPALARRTQRLPSIAWRLGTTTFGEIFSGIKLGAAYAFDDAAYERFHPLAERHGLSLPPPEVPEPPPGCSADDHLVIVQYTPGDE